MSQLIYGIHHFSVYISSTFPIIFIKHWSSNICDVISLAYYECSFYFRPGYNSIIKISLFKFDPYIFNDCTPFVPRI